jgi:hypothetical protein
MTTYYIGADVHSNSTELAIERNKRIMARHKVPTTIAAISVNRTLKNAALGAATSAINQKDNLFREVTGGI